MSAPKILLIYYGWLNAFNSDQHGWDNENVAQELSCYDLLVLGDGVQDPGHGDFANTQIIIPRIKELSPDCKIFGYVTVNQDEAWFKTKVEQWEDLQVDGIFMDEAGFDFGKTRDQFNDCVAYVHSQVKACTCFVNAWNPHHVLSRVEDPLYPNANYNPQDNKSLLSEFDWYLFESDFINTDQYQDRDFLVDTWNWKDKMSEFDAAILERGKGVNIASCGIIEDSHSKGQTLFNLAYNAAILHDMNAIGTSDTLYGSSSSKSKMWDIPE